MAKIKRSYVVNRAYHFESLKSLCQNTAGILTVSFSTLLDEYHLMRDNQNHLPLAVTPKRTSIRSGPALLIHCNRYAPTPPPPPSCSSPHPRLSIRTCCTSVATILRPLSVGVGACRLEKSSTRPRWLGARRCWRPYAHGTRPLSPDRKDTIQNTLRGTR